MTTSDEQNRRSSERLNELIADYLRDGEQGVSPAQEDFIRQYPQFESELREFFSDLEKLPHPATEDATEDFSEATSSSRMIGPYKLLERIGEGGMGEVWVAEQLEPIRRKVAIKLIKAGMDSRQVISRFEAERQALALMDHPNIAKVLDGGLTDQGRPYFAMEYVKGIPFTEYCDQAKLSLSDRLQLFIPVCQAIQHAHQKGIIHRDLKPSNILICLYDGRPVPKVIDFGLAKAMHQPLTDKTLYTAHGMMVGTPLYMSPEQAEHNNLDVDTRTDIYSLGVLLYELLTGSTPLERQQFKDAALAEILRLIKEVEPPKPSTRLSGNESLPSVAAQRNVDPQRLCKSLSGDLDWIVMKALDKERSRRYETAVGLSRDIERVLADEPIEARPPSQLYRLRKTIRKHRTAALALTTIVAGLVIGIIGASWGYFRAKDAEVVASKAATAAEKSEEKAVKALGLVTTERDAKQDALSRIKSQAAALESQTYRMGLQNALNSIFSGQLDLAKSTLLELPEAQRRWEWEYLLAESEPWLVRYKLPEGTDYHPSKDGRYLVVYNNDNDRVTGTPGPIFLYDMVKGEIANEFSLPAFERILAVAVSAEARRVAMVVANKLTGQDEAFPQDSSLYVWDRSDQSIVWDEKTTDVVGQVHYGTRSQIDISSDGERLALVGYKREEVGSSAVGVLIDIAAASRNLTTQFDGYLRIDGSGQICASGTGWGRGIKLFDIRSAFEGKEPIAKGAIELEVDDWRVSSSNGNIIFSSDGKWRIYSEADEKVTKLNYLAADAEQLLTYENDKCAVFILSGELLASISRSNPHETSLGHVPAGASLMAVHEESSSVFVRVGRDLLVYPLPDAEMIRKYTLRDPWSKKFVLSVGSSHEQILVEIADNCLWTADHSRLLSLLPSGYTDWADHLLVNQLDGSIYATYITSSLGANDNQVLTIDVLDTRTKIEREHPLVKLPADRFWWIDNVSLSPNCLWLAICVRNDSFVRTRIYRISPNDEFIFEKEIAGQTVWMGNEGVLSLNVGTLEFAQHDAGNRIWSMTAIGAAVSHSGKFLATIESNQLTVFELPNFSKKFSSQLTTTGELYWGQADERIFIMGVAEDLVFDVPKQEVVLRMPVPDSQQLEFDDVRNTYAPYVGDLVVLSNRICSAQSRPVRWRNLLEAESRISGTEVKQRAVATLVSVLKAAGNIGEESIRGSSVESPLDLYNALNLSRDVMRQCELSTSLTKSGVQAELSHWSQENGFKIPLVLERHLFEHWKPRATALHAAAWKIICSPDAGDGAYELALQHVEMALTQRPEYGPFHSALGAAFYRCGRYAEAVTKLSESIELNRDSSNGRPAWADLYFLALAHKRCGNEEVAQEFHDQFLAVYDDPELKLADSPRVPVLWSELHKVFNTEESAPEYPNATSDK